MNIVLPMGVEAPGPQVWSQRDSYGTCSLLYYSQHEIDLFIYMYRHFPISYHIIALPLRIHEMLFPA